MRRPTQIPSCESTTPCTGSVLMAACRNSTRDTCSWDTSAPALRCSNEGHPHPYQTRLGHDKLFARIVCLDGLELIAHLHISPKQPLPRATLAAVRIAPLGPWRLVPRFGACTVHHLWCTAASIHESQYHAKPNDLCSE